MNVPKEKKQNYQKSWRATLEKPETHDGIWTWFLEWSENWTEVEADPRRTRDGHTEWTRMKSHPDGPAPAGTAGSEESAKNAAHVAKAWYSAQDKHEPLPVKKEVPLR